MDSFSVLCDECAAGPDWIVIQRRMDGNVSFHRTWQEYSNGFGSFNGEFFIGLEKLRWLTKSRPYELYVELVDFGNQNYYAHYDNFLIGSEKEKYMLKSLGNYTGDAGDALTYNLHDKFTTLDSDNDKWPQGNCANWYEGGGWFNLFGNSNLFGKYLKGAANNERGIWWFPLKKYISLKSVKMLIRRKYTLV